MRTLAIGVVPALAATPSDVALRRTEEITYLSRFTTAETFTQRALVETHRRGLENAGQVAAVMDGADWLQGLADHHCPRALRILDFAHVAQHIAAQCTQFVAPHPEWATDTTPSPKSKTTKPAHDHPWRRAVFGSAKFTQYPKKLNAPFAIVPFFSANLAVTPRDEG